MEGFSENVLSVAVVGFLHGNEANAISQEQQVVGTCYLADRYLMGRSFRILSLKIDTNNKPIDLTISINRRFSHLS